MIEQFVIETWEILLVVIISYTLGAVTSVIIIQSIEKIIKKNMEKVHIENQKMLRGIKLQRNIK